MQADHAPRGRGAPEPGGARPGRAHHSTGTGESLSAYTSRSNVHASCSSGRKVTLDVICARAAGASGAALRAVGALPRACRERPQRAGPAGRACRIMACISDVISLSGFSGGGLARGHTQRRCPTHSQRDRGTPPSRHPQRGPSGGGPRAPVAGGRAAGLDVERPPLQDLLGRDAGDHEHHLLQLALQQPVCALRARPQRRTGPRASAGGAAGAAGAPDICCSTLLRYCATPGSVVTIIVSP